MGRKESREIALHLIFEFGFQAFESEEIVASRLEQSVLDSLSGDIALYAGPLEEDQKRYIISTVVGVGEHLTELDEVISSHSTNWSANRLSKITTAILRLALYEMKYTEDVPVSAAINEAVELAKKYDSKEASGFINGVLGAVSRSETAKND
ncbi:MAG: transcription antitermination factor NusB [Butyricicoccus sp.]